MSADEYSPAMSAALAGVAAMDENAQAEAQQQREFRSLAEARDGFIALMSAIREAQQQESFDEDDEAAQTWRILVLLERFGFQVKRKTH